MECVSWERSCQLADELSNLILQSDCQPNLIVAVARGGFVPARLLSNATGVKKLSSIGIAYVDNGRSHPEIYAAPCLVGSKDRIILVEDALESGRSLFEAQGFLASKGAKVWTAAFYYRSDSVVIPDFSLGVSTRIPKFPWE